MFKGILSPAAEGNPMASCSLIKKMKIKYYIFHPAL
jgi:hypothetical protein